MLGMYIKPIFVYFINSRRILLPILMFDVLGTFCGNKSHLEHSLGSYRLSHAIFSTFHSNFHNHS